MAKLGLGLMDPIFWGCDEQVRQRRVAYDPLFGFSVGMQSDHP